MSAASVNWSNPDAVREAEERVAERKRQEKQKRAENSTIKQRLQQDRQEHTFTVEWYGRELSFNPLPQEASEALNGKRERMAHCVQNNEWEEFAEQADYLAQMAPEWLAEAWDGDEPMLAGDWTDIYDDDELLKLLTKVDQKGGGAETEAVLEFLGK